GDRRAQQGDRENGELRSHWSPPTTGPRQRPSAVLVACLYARPVLPDARDPACVERDCGRAKLLLECRTWGEDGLSGRTAKKAPPPRSSALGKFDVVFAPARYMSSLLALAQPGQFVEFGTQSATHSARLPTMSKAPRAETQLLRAPVRDGEPSPEPDVLRAGVEMQVTLSCGEVHRDREASVEHVRKRSTARSTR